MKSKRRTILANTGIIWNQYAYACIHIFTEFHVQQKNVTQFTRHDPHSTGLQWVYFDPTTVVVP